MYNKTFVAWIGACLAGVAGCGAGGTGADSGAEGGTGGGAGGEVGGGQGDARGLDAQADTQKDTPAGNPSDPLTCKPASVDFSGADGGVVESSALRVCYAWMKPPAASTCAVTHGTVADKMNCKESVELIAFGPEAGSLTWRGVTQFDDPPRQIRSASHGTVTNSVVRGEVKGLPTATDITITLVPSAYWPAYGSDDYVVRARIEPPVVKILSVSRAPAPAK